MKFKILLLLMIFALNCLPYVQAQDVGTQTEQTGVVQDVGQTDIQTPEVKDQAYAVVVKPDVSGEFTAGDTLTIEQLANQGKFLIKNKPLSSDGYEVWAGWVLAFLFFLWNVWRYGKKRIFNKKT